MSKVDSYEAQGTFGYQRSQFSMRIKQIALENYKRFSNLVIDEIPETARLVVLIGPNGSGKSSLFDAFLLKSQSARGNYDLTRDDARREYYIRQMDAEFAIHTQELARRIKIEFHEGSPPSEDWSTIFNIRTAYRVESDFRLTSLAPVTPSSEKARFARIIDPDQAVSDNYSRLAWKRQSDLDGDAPDHTTFGQYRKESLAALQTGMRELFSDPSLELQDFGGVGAAGSFRFAKGSVSNFHYKNLSGGEKAAFDILLDVFVKANEFQDAIYCIDEPEAHIGTGLHGRLLEAILKIVPPTSQLWIATHSVGFVRKAYELMRLQNNVAFLDFSAGNFDQNERIKPSVPDRAFWKTTYRVALDDLADLIAPSNIVICEGKETGAASGFDADCYNRLFGANHPDTLFVSRGGATQVEKSEVLVEVLQSVAQGAKIWKVIDQDDMTESARNERILQGVQVLSRRELENYLFDPEVLNVFCKRKSKEELVSDILAKTKELLHDESPEYADFKLISRDIFEYIKATTGIHNLGKDRREFALEHLVPALRESPTLFRQLEEDIFGK